MSTDVMAGHAVEDRRKWLVALLPDPLVRRKIEVQSVGVDSDAGPCWIWRGSLNDNGYGHFVRGKRHAQKKTYVHRYVYQMFRGNIPKGVEVHHTCWNRACCAPYHLELKTHKDNVKA